MHLRLRIAPPVLAPAPAPTRRALLILLHACACTGLRHGSPRRAPSADAYACAYPSRHLRLHFGLLAEMAARNGLNRISMGMSGDFETAVRFGATHVRIGSAIFGKRPPLRPMPE